MSGSPFKYKQVIAVRTDLGMSRGKIAVQVAHGAVSAAERTRITHQDVWKAWMQEGQKKVAVRVGSPEELLELRRLAVIHRIPHALIRDAGLTELPPGTLTVIGIGPAPSELVDKVTGHLKLL
ncbi:MAG TPA: peptidyl-tRNA hydrolase [Candidatus Thorarchaeota archaeon]|nr:MAG: peptidyl-tRNA hydrolase [Candidatus Thorarchaeota archaeon]RLI62169.1 MAG: peptidyl-tRNA hydrolase [Candidatus Thorarchaeota archaeon]HDD67799.1 peptidyl-tRNA hydrolase [Candidatus Thorarchaeota archaeon]